MKRLLSLLIFTAAFVSTSCDDENEPIGPVPSGGSFSLAVPEVGRSLAKSVAVSENGEHIYMQAYGSVSNSMYYSSDAGDTFEEINSFSTNERIVNVDNDGTVLTSSGMLFAADGSNMSVSLPGYEFILGDNGKEFAYSANGMGDLKYRNTNENEFHAITPPVYSGSNIKVVKAPGQGIAVVEYLHAGNPEVKVHVISEATLDITGRTLTIDNDLINQCGLNRFYGFNFQYNNVLIVKGCTGLAICDLSDNTIEYRTYPDDIDAVYTDLRDYPVQMDDEGNIYMIYASYINSQLQNVFRFEGNDLEPLDDYFQDASIGGVFVVNHHTAYYNSTTVDGTVIASMTKVDLSSGTKTQLRAIAEPLNISEAVAADDNTVLLVVNADLYRYSVSAGNLHRYDDLQHISHVNILSDGRWLAGSTGKLYLSGNEGSSWTAEENIFASSGDSYPVNETRLIGGKLLVIGTNIIPYYNQTTGMTVNNYSSYVVESTGPGSWRAANYQLNSIQPVCIGHDGTIYGNIEFTDPFTYQPTMIPYVIREGAAAAEFPKGVPALVANDGSQVRLFGANPNELEIQVRAGEDGEWKGSGSKFAPGGNLFGTYRLQMGNGIFTLVYHSEVYVLK